MAYPIILGGDHAEFEAEWAAGGRPNNERPDWPLPSFDAQDWAAAFCKIANGFGYKDSNGKPIDEVWMVTWFANALMRGYDEHAGLSMEEDRGFASALREIAEPVQALQRKADADGLTLDGKMANHLANDAHYLRSLAKIALRSDQ